MGWMICEQTIRNSPLQDTLNPAPAVRSMRQLTIINFWADESLYDPALNFTRMQPGLRMLQFICGEQFIP